MSKDHYHYPMEQLTVIQLLAVWALPLIFAITLHEAAHGWIASKLGDDTALRLGRVSLNPIKHIDFLGTIVLPIAMLVLSSGRMVFGWAKPVPINWRKLKNPRRDMALVAFAGPLANFLMAIAWTAIEKLSTILTPHGYQWAKALYFMGDAGLTINLVLMILNLIPIPPLDGSRLLYSILPQKAVDRLSVLEPYGFLILILLLVFGILYIIIIIPVIVLKSILLMLFGLA